MSAIRILHLVIPVSILFVYLSFALEGAAPPPQPVHLPVSKIGQLAEVSVLVRAGEGAGTGIVFANGPHRFVWTNAHVVANLVSVEKEISPEGKPSLSISVLEPEVVQPDLYDEDGKIKGSVTRKATIARFSMVHDLALLRLYGTDWPQRSVEFSPWAHPVGIGDRLWHTGCPKGKFISIFPHSLTSRAYEHKTTPEDKAVVYDQSAGAFCGGCSGGGMFYFDREDKPFCAGIICQYLGWLPSLETPTHGISLFIPTRRIREFAREFDCEWALDKRVKVPTKEGDRANPICDPIKVK